MGHVVELYHPVGDHERMVIGQAHDPGAQFDVAGPLGSGGELLVQGRAATIRRYSSSVKARSVSLRTLPSEPRAS